MEEDNLDVDIQYAPKKNSKPEPINDVPNNDDTFNPPDPAK